MRARGKYDAAREAGYMSAPGDAPKSALKIPLAQAAVMHVAQIGCWDSSRESSVIAGGHAQLGANGVQDHELAFVQHRTEATRIAFDLV
jgi:hypothetical protein